MYEEAVNIQIQYSALMKKPERKLKDYFKVYKTDIIVEGFLLMVLIVLGLIWKFDAIVVFGMVIAALVILFAGVRLNAMKKMLRTHLEDIRAWEMIFDETGISINKEDTISINQSWDRIAFIRAFDQTICFFSKDSIVFPVSLAYEKELLDFLKESNVGVRLIGNQRTVTVG